MIRGYNLSFLFAGLAFFLVILSHWLRYRSAATTNNRLFQFILFTGLADILFDIICTVLMTKADPSYTDLTRLCLTLFYLLQVLIPYEFLAYILSLRGSPPKKLHRSMLLWAIPSACICLLVIVNFWTEWMFGFYADGTYIKGPLYQLMYVYTLLYDVAAGIDSFFHYRELGIKKFAVIWEFFIIAGVCVAIQALYPSQLTTGFGISMGTTVLFLSVNNPSDYRDNLTGVFDKQYFFQWIQEQFSRGKRLNLIIVNLYQLRHVNQLYGSAAGDHLLCFTAQKLQEIAGSDLVFRLNDTQLLLVTRSLSQYESARKELYALFHDMLDLNGEQLHIPTAICGIQNAQELKEVDALRAYIDYLVALVPKGQDITMLQGDARTLEGFRYEREIERFLSSAIEEDLFEVCYQPVYSMKQGRFVTMEALSRLRHPTLGPIPPDVFISIAERTGQISNIALLQFRRICRFLKEHPSLLEDLRNIKFNLSPTELLRPGYSTMLINMIREAELPFSFFQFEITETVATEYSDAMFRAVSDFLDAGIGLCLDDFGSGYANLNTVLKLPFSCIKLDRSLLNGVCTDPQVASFYQSIVSALQSMGFLIVSEGAETSEETELLRGWGVDMVQGYYFSRPLSPADALALVSSPVPAAAHESQAAPT